MVALTVKLELPTDVEARLKTEHPDLNADATESYAVELFRRAVLSHADLGAALSLDRFETDALLHRHGVEEHALTHEDVESDVRTLQELLGVARR